MNFENKKEAIQLTDQMKEFEKIETPEKLLDYMRSNIRYGFVGKNDGKVYSPQIEGWGEGESPEYKPQDPEELLESGYGTCWEQTELEKDWFSKNNFEFKTFLLMFGKNISQKNPAHTLLAYEDGDMWHWIENTLDGHNGIHEYEELDDLIEAAKKIIISNAVNSGATDEDLEKYALYEYKTLVSSCSDRDEFISRVIEENQP